MKPGTPDPPRWARTLLRRFAAPRWVEELEGDLAEQFHAEVARGSLRKARRTYWRDVLLYLSKSYVRRRPEPAYRQARGPIMLKNYVTIALRNLQRHAGYTFINVGGLALGLACCLVIFLFVQDELRYDAHHAQAPRIYRVVNEHHGEEGVTHRAATPPSLAPALARTFPEVLRVVRFFPRQKTLITYEDRQFVEERGFLVDSTVFAVFSFRLLHGDPATALTVPNTIVLTASTAQKYFGREDPLGRTLTLDHTRDYEVTGVMQDLPAQSHLQFSYLGSFATMRDIAPPALEPDNWRWQDFYTYLLLPAGYDPARLHAKIPAFIAEQADPHTRPSGIHHAPYLQPLSDIHLHSSHLQHDVAIQGSYTAVQAFSWIAVIILLIACFNFINLATARSSERAKEVGVRKAVGAYRFQLVRQFLTESTLLTLLSLALALGLVTVSLPAVNQFFGKSLVLFGNAPWLLPGLLVAVLLLGLAAGSLPALLLSTFHPVAVLKGRAAAGSRPLTALRKGLVVAQFAGSIVLIIATVVVFNQLTYIQQSNLGFNEEQVVLLPLRGAKLQADSESFKAEVLRHPGVVAATAARGVPGDLVPGDGVLMEGHDLPFMTSIMLVDHDYTETLGMEMAAGRAFSRRFPSDANQAFLVNETAARALGWSLEETLGKEAAWYRWGRDAGEQRGPIIGVVKDFNFRSLHQAVDPVVMTIYPPAFSQLALRVRPDNLDATLNALAETWETWVPDWPFEYRFLDEQFAALYQSERTLGHLFLVFSLFALLVAGLGLFGLATFSAARRTKEIGIRKTLGASTPGLVALLSGEFITLVLIAFVLAAPVAYLVMTGWLEAFAYRIEIRGGEFLIAGLAALGVAFLTVSYQAIKAALADPVQSLRYE